MGQERELQERICDFLTKREEFRDDHLTVIVEDKEEPIQAVRKAIASKAGLAVVISAVGYRRRANSGSAITGTLSLQIDVFEKMIINRTGKDGMTGQTANEIIRNILHWKKFEGLGVMRFIDSRRADTSEYAHWESNWEIEIGADEVKWGSNGSIFGIVITRRITNGGTLVEEPNRFGNVKMVGVRDKHIKVDVTAFVSGTQEDLTIGDKFTMEVNGEERSFTCTASELDESVEESTTLHIAGRTY